MTLDESQIEEVLEVLMAHFPTQGVMVSPNHWAYRKDESAWFAHCGTGYEDQKGCGWTSEPHVFPDKMTARRAAMRHLAAELKGAEVTD